MHYADLHIHSSYSDGILSPEEIVKASIEQGLKCISITDHDTIASQYITKQYISGIKIIPGVEFSTEYEGREIHILGYFIDIDNKKILQMVGNLQKTREERALQILQKLKEVDVHIELEEIKKYHTASFGRGNIANAIAKKGYAKNYKEAFLKYLDKDKIAFVPGKKLNYKDVLQLINESGGIPVLAHPGKIYRSMGLEDVIKEFKCYGLKGLEVYHTSHTSNQISTFYNLSKKYKLVITGGSDFHGKENIEPLLGIQGINETLLNKLINFKYK